MTVDRSYVARNAASRGRLETVASGLREGDFTRDVGGGWTVAALLAHLAFWDRFVIERLTRWEGSGFEAAVFDADVINDAALPGWRAIPGPAARQEVLAAAVQCDERVERVGDELAAAIIGAGRQRMLDRSLHREEHIARIERVSGRR
jgi:hypothetical protein